MRLSFLLDLAPSADGLAPQIAVRTGCAPILDPRDERDDDDEADEMSDLGLHDRSDRPAPVYLPIEDTFCMIEYAQPGTAAHTRRVTLKTCRPGPYGPLIGAVCHERRAYRTFRFSRISALIDVDGEVHNPRTWFTDTLGIDPEALDTSPRAALAEAAREIRQALAPELSLLTIAARSDANFHADELDMIEQYVENEIPHLQRAGMLPASITVEVLDQLRPVIAAMRPQRGTAHTAVGALMRRDEGRIKRFIRYLDQVVHADGKVHPAEEAMIADFQLDCENARRRIEGNQASDGLAGATVVFTGTFEQMTRRQGAEIVLAHGGTVLDRVNYKVRYLVAGPGGGRKRADAEALNVAVISELAFRKLAGLD